MIWFRLGIALGIIAAAYSLYLRVDYLARENDALSTALKTANERIVALDNIITAQRAIVEEERNQLDEIDKDTDKPEYDADTAPVLGNALNRLRKPPAH